MRPAVLGVGQTWLSNVGQRVMPDLRAAEIVVLDGAVAERAPLSSVLRVSGSHSV